MLSKLDIFGEPTPKINFDGKRSISSIPGVVASVLMILGLALYAGVGLERVYTGRNPLIANSEIHNQYTMPETAI